MIPGAHRQVVERLPIDNGVGGSTLLAAGPGILRGEFDAMGVDFAYPILGEQLRISDTTTPANNYRGDPHSKWTYTTPHTKLCRQADGIYRYGNHNLCPESETFGTTWTTTATLTSNATTAPNGTVTADLLTTTTANQTHRFEGVGTELIAQPAGPTVIQASVFAKPNGYNWILVNISDFVTHVGGTYFNVSTGAIGGNNIVGSATIVGSSIELAPYGFYLCKVQVRFPTGSAAGLHLRLQVVESDGAGTFTGNGTSGTYFWGATMKRYPVQEPADVASYVGMVTTSVVKVAPAYEWDASGIPLGVKLEEARTNLCLRCCELSNASWTKVTMTTAFTSTGPDGVANYATRCTATGANATALQSITSASSTRITSMFVKRITGSGSIQMTQNNGTLWTTVTTTTSWTRVEIAAALLTNPIVGIRIVTSGDAIDVAYFQHEIGAFITSPIQTTSVTVARAVDNISLATSVLPFSATVGTLYAKFRPVSTAAIAFAVAIDDGTANERFAIGSSAAAAGLFSVVDGGVAQTAPLTGGTVTANADNKVAASWVANDFAISTSGSTVAVDTGGTLPTVTSLKFGTAVSAASLLNGWLSEVVYIKRTMSDTELIARATS